MTAEDLARQFEGCELRAYQDLADVWTIGIGHAGKDVYAGLEWTQDQCEMHLACDLHEAQVLLDQYSPGLTDAGVIAALTDFVFNLGIGNYRTSTLCKLVNQGAWAQVKTELLKWDHSGGIVVEGLLRRRQAEADLIEC